ncbi:MAG: extracellular matrix regulator RemB [Christensenellales bacterium]|jgi:hypothetical protein
MLHIGGDVMIPLREVVAVFNQACMQSPENQAFLKTIAPDRLVSLEGTCKAIVLTQKGGALFAYRSPISCATLLKRSRRFPFQ